MHPAIVIAHIAADGRLHQLQDHLLGTARRAQEAACWFDSGPWAELAGLWHDLGKQAQAFQHMICSAAGLDAHLESVGGRVDHSTAGALLAMERYRDGGLPLAFVIAGHHAGLADKADLDARLAQKRHLLGPALAGGNQPEERQRPPAPSFLASPARGQDKDDLKRSYEFWVRLLYSALVDADFLDTEEFHEGGPAGAKPRLRSVGEPLPALKARFDTYMADKQRAAGLAAPGSRVHRIRDHVLHACRERGPTAQGCSASPLRPAPVRHSREWALPWNMPSNTACGVSSW